MRLRSAPDGNLMSLYKGFSAGLICCGGIASGMLLSTACRRPKPDVERAEPQNTAKADYTLPCILQALKGELLGSIQKGVDFVNKK